MNIQPPNSPLLSNEWWAAGSKKRIKLIGKFCGKFEIAYRIAPLGWQTNRRIPVEQLKNCKILLTIVRCKGSLNLTCHNTNKPTPHMFIWMAVEGSSIAWKAKIESDCCEKCQGTVHHFLNFFPLYQLGLNRNFIIMPCFLCIYQPFLHSPFTMTQF